MVVILYNVICSKTFFDFLIVIWYCDYNYDICHQKNENIKTSLMFETLILVLENNSYIVSPSLLCKNIFALLD